MVFSWVLLHYQNSRPGIPDMHEIMMTEYNKSRIMINSWIRGSYTPINMANEGKQ